MYADVQMGVPYESTQWVLPVYKWMMQCDSVIQFRVGIPHVARNSPTVPTLQ